MSWESQIEKIKDVTLEKNKDLTSFTTMRLKSSGDLITVKTKNALAELLPILNSENIKYRLIGWGANQLIPSVKDWIYLKLDFEFDRDELTVLKDEYSLPASCSLNLLTSAAMKHGLIGWEVFTGIPASLGGAIFMNAGTNLGEIGSLITKVEYVDRLGKFNVHDVTPKSFSYRKCNFIKDGEVITNAWMKHNGVDLENIPSKIKDYMEYRKKTQPLASFNCGCVFKNPNPQNPAGKLIDMLGLGGFERNGLRISTKHCNFMEHFGGNATFEDFMWLQNYIKEQVLKNYGIEIELEVKF